MLLMFALQCGIVMYTTCRFTVTPSQQLPTSEPHALCAPALQAEKEWGRTTSKNYPHMGIGAGSHIHKAIVDKNARIGQVSEEVSG
jgi:hypothetical protein